MKAIITLLAIFILQPAFAAENGTNSTNGPIDYKSSYEQTSKNDSATEYPANIELVQVNNEFWYIVLLSSLCVISLTIVLYFLKQSDHTAKDMVNAAGLTLIIFGTIILVLVASTSEQLTAAIGILGAIAGYLFRSAQENTGKSPAP